MTDVPTGRMERHTQNVFIDEGGNIRLIDNDNLLAWGGRF